MRILHLPGIAIVASVLALSAASAAAALYSDDLPAPPSTIAQGSASPKAHRGLTKFSANIGTHLKRAERYDYPGEYAQRFDGVSPVAPKSRPPLVQFQWGNTKRFAPGRSTTTLRRR